MQIATSLAPHKQLPEAPVGRASWWEPSPDFATPSDFESRLRRALAAARREAGAAAVLVIAADAAGAATCRRLLRDTDVATRRADGTLAVLFEGFDAADEAERVARLVGERLQRALPLQEEAGAALGIALSDTRDRSPHAMLERAAAPLRQPAGQ